MSRKWQLPAKQKSLWIETAPGTEYPKLQENLRTDIVVLGGGLVGITTALLLQQAGFTVALIEAGRIGLGVSGHTTAKISAAHGLIYDYLINKFSRAEAQLYADANQSAIRDIETLVRENKIDCGFRTTFAAVYAETAEELKKVTAEAKAAKSLGLPASFVEESELPFAIKGAVRFDQQACFHPRRYLLGLAKLFTAAGGLIYEQTRASDVKDGKPCQVTIPGGIVSADHVVVATHFPIFDPSLFFVRLVQQRSSVLAIPLRDKGPEDKGLDGLYLSAGEKLRSMRRQDIDGVPYMLIGGEKYKTGHGGDTILHYRQLADYAATVFDLHTIDCCWSTQDNHTPDRVPFIGLPSPISKNVWCATGFKGWGMTGSMTAARILAATIQQKANPWADLHTPTRFKAAVRTVTEIGAHAMQATTDFVLDHLLDGLDTEIEKLPTGEGKVIATGKGKVAVYRDADGNLHKCSAVCTHMRCTVKWNPAEDSWDCPCHGSRYDIDGNVLNTPAIDGLPKITDQQARK